MKIGSTLGSYEITAPLGEGGMGVVYRATDSKLKRGPSPVDELLEAAQEKGIAIIISDHGEERDSSLLCS
ncbi:MAG TPA: hypothetical protein VE129_16985 [Thermoanaerobaculia bacterium]|nr:hypothetical protein [Thermoanaerobaculia bacterium]